MKPTKYLLFAAGLAAVLMPSAADAATNNKWWYKCEKKDCKSCQSGSQCEPEISTYENSTGYETEEEAAAAGKEACKVEEDNSTDGSKDGSGQSQNPGITPANYQRSGIQFSGVGPDHVKYETVDGARKPVQMDVKHYTVSYTDLPDGYQVSRYPTSRLPAADSTGIRAIPSGMEASSITIYRNPDGGTTTTQGKLDVVHKQRHPQSGVWVTRVIRRVAPQGNNTWSTKWYLGDPVENPTLQPYREVAITRTPNADGTESTREITRDRDSAGNLVITSDIDSTYAFYKHGDPVKLSETRHTGTGSESTTTWTYYHDAANQASFNKPATTRRSDGGWENITYQGSTVTGILVTRTVSGWLDQAAPAIGTAPDENASRVVNEIEAKNETGTFSREEKVQGVLVSKTWGERYKDSSGFLIEKSRVETGTTTLLTIRTGHPDNESTSEADRGRLKSIQYPDGTVELHRHALQGSNRVETVDRGAGTLSSVTDGTRTASTYTDGDILVKEVVSDIASGIVLSTREAIEFDANGNPSRWAYVLNPKLIPFVIFRL